MRYGGCCVEIIRAFVPLLYEERRKCGASDVVCVV